MFILHKSGFEVNFMDDVGQTLLNWASAFGTQEMVRAQKSISVIYYLASFITVILRYLACMSVGLLFCFIFSWIN